MTKKFTWIFYGIASAAILFAGCMHKGPGQSNGEYDICGFGAVGDGKTLNTSAIQNAIDKCAQAGGGTVRIPQGKYLSGTLFLKSGVNLHLAHGAVILGSPRRSDYKGGRQIALILAQQLENTAITGSGTIDGNGASPEFMGADFCDRPYILRFEDCRNVTVNGITLKNSASWVQHYLNCDGVRINGIVVYSHGNLNNDGIDIDSRNVVVSDCIIDSDDDALCLKSDERPRSCENVTVTNCVIASNCNAIKLGTASLGGFKNILIQNCVVRPAKEHKQRRWINTISGIAIEAVDGGIIDGVHVSNISMTGIRTPIFVRLGKRLVNPGRKPGISEVRNIIIQGITAKGESLIASSVTGIPEGRIDNVILRDIVLDCPGGGTQEMADANVPEVEKNYPEATMFGKSLPAYGLYIRHADNVTLENVSLRLDKPDARPAIFCDDVSRLCMRRVEASDPAGESHCFKFVNVRERIISDCFVFSKKKSVPAGY